jgi:hypothetical protein
LKFINVSVERARLDAATARALGWPQGLDVLWIWGSGRYRASPVYLAVADLGALLRRASGSGEPGPHWGETGPVRFYSGGIEQPRWSWREPDAVPLFCAGDVGELSARHNATFRLYFLTYNTGNPRGITLRHAPNPWGPWSPPIVIFDPGWGSPPGHPVGAGHGNFMHIPWNVARVDNVQDDAFLSGRRDNDWGGEYGPYQISRFSVGQRSGCDLFYTMSTWNPYQAMLMRTHITDRDLSG